ncbi:hypothetical protein VP01_864g1 [Puccinia sorghi]|uniref:Wax synthase domain-containing protein n=1 Tax=Puccinia sorghi TaxID=27349 RepID=A0A0L6U8T1_9BASI|nr:hypothetical protein VP01_864g1 [Puccinia sorghi]
MAHSSSVVEPYSNNEVLRMVGGYVFLVPLVMQAYLMNPVYERSVGARAMRLGLMPLIIYLVLTRTPQRLYYPMKEYFHWNFAFISFPSFHAVCLAIQFGLFRGSVFASKLQLIKAGNYRADLYDDDDDEEEEEEKEKEGYQKHEEVTQTLTESSPSFLARVKFTIWLLFSPRGLETSWAPPLEIVPEGPSMSLGQFFMYTLSKLVVCHIVGTGLWIFAAQYAQHPKAAFGVFAEYIPPLHFLTHLTSLDYITSACFGAVSWISLETLACLFNLLDVLVYHVGPSILPKDLAPGKFNSRLYPPLFNNLSSRESMVEFWSRGWHAIFRRNIIFCGWNPTEYLFSGFGKDTAKTAGMMGGMVFSGIFHEYREWVIAVPSRFDPSVPAFKMFVLCGAAMVAEVNFKRKTGRLVKGWPGRIWCLIIFAIYGKPLVASCCRLLIIGLQDRKRPRQGRHEPSRGMEMAAIRGSTLWISARKLAGRIGLLTARPFQQPS